MSEEQLEYSAKLLANNIELEKRNKEIYEGFIATTQELCEATEEIERLNNIINELEKWVREDKECFETQFYMGRCVNFQCILDKLQELKGSDKE